MRRSQWPVRCATWLLLILLAAAGAQTPARALTREEATAALVGKLWDANPPGQVLFSEDFESGTLDPWHADSGWKVVDRAEGGKCAQVVAMDNQIANLVLKAHLSITPGHPIAVCWRTRLAAGHEPIYLRVDFYGADGKQGTPYARQDISRAGPQWTQNTMLVSDWFPSYTRAITIWFHQAQKSDTTSQLDDIRVVDLAAATDAMLREELPRYQAMADRLATEAAALPATAVNDAWRAAILERLAQLQAGPEAVGKLEPGSKEFNDGLRGTAVTLSRFNDAVAALKTGALQTPEVLIYVTRPITSQMVTPFAQELPGGLAGRVALNACAGQTEPASLVLWAPEPLAGVMVKATDLSGPAGNIPAANVDVKWVKCWYKGGNAPYGIAVVRDRKALIPQLLLNDDSLVKVDLVGQHNSLKLSFPEGPRYVPIDDPKVVPWGSRMELKDFPVKDSPTLLPADLPAGRNKQVWVTVRVPESAAPGSYAGSLILSAGGKELGRLALTVRVLPFKLSPPKTHYDPTQDFTYSLYYWGWLDPTGRGSISYNQKSVEQFRAELEYMRDRGIVAPCMIWPASMIYDDERAFRQHLQIAKEVGFSGRPLVFGSSDVIGAPAAPTDLEALKARIRRTVAIAREYGFPEVYFYGIDEATGDTLKNERVAWKAVHEAGGKVIVSGFEGQYEAVGDLLDLFNRAGDPMAEQPERWHKLGHKLWNYGNPQTPVEDPLIYRRNYGLYLWRADFDGENTYCFMDSEGLTWNDFDGPAYRDHTVAYPTVDGVVATLEMEGFRAGTDDVRYATTLRLVIARAMQGKDPALQARAQGDLKWLDGLDTRTADLDQVRLQMIERILALQPS